VIGFLAGLGLLFSYLGAAWTKSTDSSSIFGSGLLSLLLTLGIFTLVGIFLFPRTVGMALTPMGISTPVAFLIALFRNGFTYSLFILLAGAAGLSVTMVIGKFRPDAT
jgi:hypothetical protein